MVGYVLLAFLLIYFAVAFALHSYSIRKEGRKSGSSPFERIFIQGATRKLRTVTVAGLEVDYKDGRIEKNWKLERWEVD